jgi:hypothetical protein
VDELVRFLLVRNDLLLYFHLLLQRLDLSDELWQLRLVRAKLIDLRVFVGKHLQIRLVGFIHALEHEHVHTSSDRNGYTDDDRPLCYTS